MGSYTTHTRSHMYLHAEILIELNSKQNNIMTFARRM